MKKGKMFKKSISCLLAALMIIASMPFTAITAFADTASDKAYIKENYKNGAPEYATTTATYSNTLSNHSDYMKNIIVSGNYGQRADDTYDQFDTTTNRFNFASHGVDSLVAIYDTDNADIRIPVAVEAKEGNARKNVNIYVGFDHVSLDNGGQFSLGNSTWKRANSWTDYYDNNDNSHDFSSDRNGNVDRAENTANGRFLIVKRNLIGVQSQESKQWKNYIKFTPDSDFNNNYYASLTTLQYNVQFDATLNWTSWGSSSNYNKSTPGASVNYKVINYAPLKKIMNSQELKDTFEKVSANESNYNSADVAKYYKAVAALFRFHLTNGLTVDTVSTKAAEMKSLVNNYNAVKDIKEIPKHTYTFVKTNGEEVTFEAKDDSAAYSWAVTEGNVPNTKSTDKKPLDDSQHKWTEYTWPTSPSDYVFTEQKEEVTENHDFRTLDTCTCGAKVDVESFEAAKKEADVVLTQSSLYEDTSYKNFSKTVTDAGSKRTNGELLCQKDFDNATFEILYAKTLLKKLTGTVTLTVYDQNNKEITDAGNTYKNNYGEQITIEPATAQNVYKYVIEKDGATSEIYGQPSISYVVTGNATVKAYCNKAQSADEKYTKVTFLVGGKISDIKYVKAGDTLDTSTANKLQFPFFTTGDWDQTSVEGKADVSSVTVRAELKPYNDNKCNVHFAGGNEASLAYNTKVDVIADYQMDQGFDYALSTSLKTDDIIAYMHGTVFYVPARSEVFVIKVPKGDSAKHPKINTVGVFTSYDEKYKYVGFNCKFSLPADCTPVEWGITFIPILQSGRPETSKVFRVKPLSAENEYTATLSLTKTNSKYSAIRAKAYLKYKDANNNIQVIEGDEHIQAFASENKFGITDINQNQN